MSRATGLLLSIFLCLVSAAPAKDEHAPTKAVVAASSPALISIRRDLIGRIEGGELPSMSIGVAQDDQVLWLEGLGWADREARTGATPDTVYAVASVSKSLTATVAATLVARGRMRWEDEVSTGLPGVAPSITLEELFDQTSGLPHLWWYEYRDAPESALRRAQILEAARAVAFQPGQGFLYSNLNPEIAAQHIERVLAEPFERIAERELFVPVGMTHTATERWVGRDSTAAGYNKKGRVRFSYRLRPRGGAGFFSSARDLLRYAQFHLGTLLRGPSLISPAHLVEMHGDGTPAGARGYAFGWGRLELEGHDVVLISDGEMLGATAAVMIVPTRKLAIVLLTNTNADMLEHASAIADAVVSGFGKRLADGAHSLEARWSTAASMPTGSWSGALQLGSAEIKVTMDFDTRPSPTIRLGDGLLRTLDNLEWDRGLLNAKVAGSFPLPSDEGRSHDLELVLHLSGSTIDGFAVDSLAADSDHHRYGFPYAMHLRRQGQ